MPSQGVGTQVSAKESPKTLTGWETERSLANPDGLRKGYYWIPKDLQGVKECEIQRFQKMG